MGHIFLLLCIPDTVGFMLLDFGCFCILINILELCFGMQFSHLEQLNPLGASLGGTRAVFSPGFMFSTTEAGLLVF